MASGSTTLVITNAASTGGGPVNIPPNAVISGTGIPTGTTIIQVSGTPGGNGTYTASNSLTINETVTYSGSWESNWEQVVQDMDTTTGNTLHFLQYEGALQCTGPTIADCNTMSTSELATNPKKYCANNAGPTGDALVAGYVVGDTLTYNTGTISNFSCTVATIAPDGAPLTCTIVGGTGSGSVTDVALVGGSGHNIAADLTVAGGNVTTVTLYSQTAIEMLYAWFQDSSFKTLYLSMYSTMQNATYPSTIGVAQLGYAGGQLINNPWPLFMGSLYDIKLQNWYAFQQQNGGTGP